MKEKSNNQSKSNFPKGVNFPTFLSAVDVDLSNINSLHFTPLFPSAFVGFNLAVSIEEKKNNIIAQAPDCLYIPQPQLQQQACQIIRVKIYIIPTICSVAEFMIIDFDP